MREVVPALGPGGQVSVSSLMHGAGPTSGNGSSSIADSSQGWNPAHESQDRWPAWNCLRLLTGSGSEQSTAHHRVSDFQSSTPFAVMQFPFMLQVADHDLVVITGHAAVVAKLAPS